MALPIFALLTSPYAQGRFHLLWGLACRAKESYARKATLRLSILAAYHRTISLGRSDGLNADLTIMACTNPNRLINKGMLVLDQFSSRRLSIGSAA
jgi:hypothetical protein